MKHRLDALLRPRSIAVIGASSRADTVGSWVMINLRKGGYKGRLYPINPRYQEVDEQACYPDLAALPEVPELVVFAIADLRLEAALTDAIAAGIKACVIQSSLVLDDDDDPPLKERVRTLCEDAGVLVCGANGMGYYNVRDHVWTCGFDSSSHPAPGNISLISHSGAGMSGPIDSDARLRINFAVSTGNEIGVTMDAYLDFVLDLPETRVVGLFIETARNPAGIRAALKKAADKQIPIVALKVGRTRASAELALSHSGAMAGDDATYAALFDRYGVQRARDQNEFATMLILFAELNPVGAGGLVTLHDSGGERQLLIDLAADEGVPLTELAPTTRAALADLLDPELPAVNPLDAWSRGGPSAAETMTRSLTLLMQDPGAAIGAVVHDRAPGGEIYPSYLAYMQRARAESGKPVALVSATQGTGHDPAVVTSTHAGYPVLDGVTPFLAGVRALFAYRDFLLREPYSPQKTSDEVVKKWRGKLRDGKTLSEFESLQLLASFGISTANCRLAKDVEGALSAADDVGYPVVIKTAQPDLLHKSDQSGVFIGINDATELKRRYDELQQRLGPQVLVASHIDPGVEMLLGAKHDPQFGAIVVLGFGGVLAETIGDVEFALPPFNAQHARRVLDQLKLRALLDGVRGMAPTNVDAFCELAARFSEMVAALDKVLQEVDMNPVIVNREGAVAVDALVIGRDRRAHRKDRRRHADN